MLTDDTIEKILYGRRMAWDIAGCAAHAAIRRGQLSKWLNAGSEMRHALDSGAWTGGRRRLLALPDTPPAVDPNQGVILIEIP